MEEIKKLNEQDMEAVNGGIPEKIVLVCKKMEDCIILEDLSNVSAAPEQR